MTAFIFIIVNLNVALGFYCFGVTVGERRGRQDQREMKSSE